MELPVIEVIQVTGGDSVREVGGGSDVRFLGAFARALKLLGVQLGTGGNS